MANLYDAGRAAAVEWLFRSPLPEEASKALPDPTVQAPAIEQPMVDSAANARVPPRSLLLADGAWSSRSIASSRKAKADVEAGRITHPQGSNAIEKYRAVLALKPDLAEATQAIQDLLERFLSAARDALDGEQWDAAQSKLDEAAMIAPASTRVANLRDALNVRKSVALMQHVTEETRRLQAEEVVNKLVALGRKALDANDMKMAEAHLAQAVVILPESDQVTKLRDELDTRKVKSPGSSQVARGGTHQRRGTDRQEAPRPRAQSHKRTRSADGTNLCRPGSSDPPGLKPCGISPR